MYLYDIRNFLHLNYLGHPGNKQEDSVEKEYEVLASRIEHLCFWAFTILTAGTTSIYLLLGYSSR